MQDQQSDPDPDPSFCAQYAPLILIGGLILAVTAICLLPEGPANERRPAVGNRHEAAVAELIKSRMENPRTYRHVNTDDWVDGNLAMMKVTYREESASEDIATSWLAAAFSDAGVLMWYYEGDVDSDSNSR